MKGDCSCRKDFPHPACGSTLDIPLPIVVGNATAMPFVAGYMNDMGLLNVQTLLKGLTIRFERNGTGSHNYALDFLPRLEVVRGFLSIYSADLLQGSGLPKLLVAGQTTLSGQNCKNWDLDFVKEDLAVPWLQFDSILVAIAQPANPFRA
jgi:hypothetical protein